MVVNLMREPIQGAIFNEMWCAGMGAAVYVLLGQDIVCCKSRLTVFDDAHFQIHPDSYNNLSKIDSNMKDSPFQDKCTKSKLDIRQMKNSD